MEGARVNRPITYPRLPRDVAESLLDEQRELSPGELTGMVGTSHPRQEWHPTIPERVTGDELRQLRSDVVSIAAGHGYPKQLPRGGYTIFDQQLAVHLYEAMGIVPAEAAAGGIWSFLATVLLPDVAAWRYPDRHRDRFIGSDLMIGTSNRHVFGRLWARVCILGALTSSRLGEDNVVNLLERPTFGGNPRLARAISEAYIRTVAASGIAQSQQLMRDAMKRLRRLAVVISFGALDDDQLWELLEEVFADSAAALRQS
jgi:hypothetical protein